MRVRPLNSPQIRLASRSLLSDLPPDRSITYIRSYGNIGDRLLNAGARRLLANTSYREVDIRDAHRYSADIGIVAGGGGWCKPWHAMPELVESLEGMYERIIVWPSSFDPRETSVRSWLRRTTAKVYAREGVSLDLVSKYITAHLSVDTAFFFDYRPYHRRGAGVLNAYRTDCESAGLPVPKGNIDLSVEAADLDHWLHTIAAAEVIRTDRAHVMIAAAMLGKRVQYRDSAYHKLRGIAEHSLRGFDVRRETLRDGDRYTP